VPAGDGRAGGKRPIPRSSDPRAHINRDIARSHCPVSLGNSVEKAAGGSRLCDFSRPSSERSCFHAIVAEAMARLLAWAPIFR
jgi:hypothetical protein